MSSAHNLAVNDIEQPCMKPNVRFDNADSALVYDTVCNYHWEIFQDQTGFVHNYLVASPGYQRRSMRYITLSEFVKLDHHELFIIKFQNDKILKMRI